MTTAFQTNAFQNNAFQIDAGATSVSCNLLLRDGISHLLLRDGVSIFMMAHCIQVLRPATTGGGAYYLDHHKHWERLRKAAERLRKRCEDDEDEECQPILVDVAEVVAAVISAPKARKADPAAVARLAKALDSAANAKRLATVQQVRDRIYKELMVINAQLVAIRAAEDDEEEAIALLLLS